MDKVMTMLKQILPSAFLAFSVLAAPVAMAEMRPPADHQQQPKMSQEEGLEHHIAHLHDVLKVTPQQEELWGPVAKAMRDNHQSMSELIKEKKSKIETQTAVEDLNAYSEIAAAHAVATKRLADAFGPFYGSLTDEQKKSADEFFRQHKHHAAMPAPKHSMPPSN
jgi:periplasmic protein CpxP/Spy